MTTETLTAEIEQLKAAYGEIATAAAPGQVLYRIPKAALPTGCTPADSPVLLVLQDGQPPKVYVKPGVKTPDGTVPRSTSVVQVGGEEWLQFSYNLTGDPTTYTLIQLVQASLQRFAKNE